MAKQVTGDGTVGKALDVLDKVASKDHPVRFTELLNESDLPKATLYRFLQTLTNQGMLQYDLDRQVYSLGVRLVRLAHTAWQRSSLAPIARPFIDQLSLELRSTIHLAQLDSGQVLYVDKRNAVEPVEMFSQAGKVGPAYCTGVGKAMLAFLTEKERDRALAQQSYHRHTPNTLCSAEALAVELDAIRETGYSFDREEHEPGIICVAVPILSSRGRVLGALSTTTTKALHTYEDLEDRVPIVSDTARKIAVEAEAWRFPDAAQHSQL